MELKNKPNKWKIYDAQKNPIAEINLFTSNEDNAIHLFSKTLSAKRID